MERRYLTQKHLDKNNRHKSWFVIEQVFIQCWVVLLIQRKKEYSNEFVQLGLLWQQKAGLSELQQSANLLLGMKLPGAGCRSRTDSPV